MRKLIKCKKGGGLHVTVTLPWLSDLRKVTSVILDLLICDTRLMLPLSLWGFCEIFVEHLAQSLVCVSA